MHISLVPLKAQLNVLPITGVDVKQYNNCNCWKKKATTYKVAFNSPL